MARRKGITLQMSYAQNSRSGCIVGYNVKTWWIHRRMRLHMLDETENPYFLSKVYF